VNLTDTSDLDVIVPTSGFDCADAWYCIGIELANKIVITNITIGTVVTLALTDSINYL
jgi:hypothetical protein